MADFPTLPTAWGQQAHDTHAGSSNELGSAAAPSSVQDNSSRDEEVASSFQATNASEMIQNLAQTSISQPTTAINGSGMSSPWMGGHRGEGTLAPAPVSQEPNGTLGPPATLGDSEVDTIFSTQPPPGLSAPLETLSGSFSAQVPQQPLISRQPWDSDGEDEYDEVQVVSKVEQQEFRTGLVYSSVMMLHAVPAFLDDDSEETIHPEKPARISHIFGLLKKSGCVARMKRVPIRDVTKEEVMLVHRADLWSGIERSAFFTSNTLALQTRALDKSSSLYVNEHSARCARLSCGGVIEMCDAVVSGRIRNGFAVVRPPGHHAEPTRSMGFCFYNNVAVATRVMQEKYKDSCRKVLILDWDIHHGNGTQSAFWEDESVLYISLHRYEEGNFFPGGTAGSHEQVGEGKGKGLNVNIAWPDKGMTDNDYMSAFQRIVMPIAMEFAPDLVIISAGFDAAHGDELGECHVSPTGYAQMTHDLASLADGKLVVALEGGYNLDAISKSALSVTNVLLGEAPPPFPPGLGPSTIANDAIEDVRKVQARYWKSIESSPYEAVEHEADGLERIDWGRMLAERRIHTLGPRYNLTALPTSFHGGIGEDDDVFEGQIMLSSGLFNENFDALIIFAHDAGNLRTESFGSTIDVQGQLGYFLDGSSKIVEWTQSHRAAIIDVTLNSQMPTVSKQPISTNFRRGRNPNQPKSLSRLEQDRRLLLHAWDNAAAMVLSANADTKVILIGLGTATDAILHLIEEREVELCTMGVVQLPAYSLIPAVSKNMLDKRKWYFRHSRVYLPHDHVYYTLDAQAKSGKRLGKVIRSDENRAIQVLSKEFSDITTYIEQCLRG